MTGKSDKVGKRERIVQAAIKLFCEHGFQNTSTASISREAGIATGTLFLYFASKEELINALYLEIKQSMTLALTADFPESVSIRKQLKHLWISACTWAQHYPDAFRFITMFRASPFISNLTREDAASSSMFAVRLIEKGIEDGKLKAMPASFYFVLFDGLWTSTVSYLFENQNCEPNPSLLKETFEVFWKGVST